MKNSSYMAYKVEKARTGSMKSMHDDQIIVGDKMLRTSLGVVLTGYTVALLLMLSRAMIGGAILWSVVMIALIWEGLFSCRTFIFSANGCTIKLFRYERTYQWEELAIKRKEYNYSEYRKESVFFSVYPVDKPVDVDPKYYCTVHGWLFTSFYVYLEDQENLAKMRYEESQYMNIGRDVPRNRKYHRMLNNKVSKQKFLQKMEEWGVELTDSKEEKGI